MSIKHHKTVAERMFKFNEDGTVNYERPKPLERDEVIKWKTQ